MKLLIIFSLQYGIIKKICKMIFSTEGIVIMYQRIVSFSLVIVILFFSLFSNLSTSYAEEIPEFKIASTSNQFYLYVTPRHNSKTIDTTPTIELRIVAPDHLQLSWMKLEINGSEVDAYFDSLNQTLSYKPTSSLAPGRYELKFHYQFNGFQEQYTTTSFEIVKPFYDPFNGKDRSLLAKQEAEALAKLNEYRSALGLPLFTINEKLTKAAQAHSNYHLANNVTGHEQVQGKANFTGTKFYDRTTLFGYFGSVSEGISYEKSDVQLAIKELFDAPYHRLPILNPNYLEVGIGYNYELTGKNSTVVNYGTTKGSTDHSLIVYPYDGQQDAKVSWYVNESPNPLRFYGLEKIYVGYPIVLSIHDEETEELKIESASLVDSKGNAVPFYQVDSSLETDRLTHLFLLPKNRLAFGETYTVTVTGKRITANEIVPFSKKWTFKTKNDIEISALTSHFSSSGKMEYIDIDFANGDFENVSYRLLDGQREVISFNGATNSFTGTLENGQFKLEIVSPSFPNKISVDVEVSGSFGNRVIKWNKEGSSGGVANNEIKIRINGKFQTYDQQPIIQNGRVLLPMRGIFESLGADVYWNANTQTVIGMRDQVKVQLTIGSQTAFLNGERVYLDVPAQIVNGRTLVPLRFVAQSLGMKVEWDEQTRTVYID